jgi:signal recognition particle GTPase
MALFDPREQRMCVGIVDDGAAGTGKTTNLASLCRLLATQHTTELYSPG